MTRRELIALPKRMGVPNRPRLIGKNWQNHVRLTADASGHFRAYFKLNVYEFFSFGLLYRPSQRAKKWSTLLRLNGDHGPHRNPDGTRFDRGPHRHVWPEALLDLPPVPGDDPPHGIVLDDTHLGVDVAWHAFAAAAGIVNAWPGAMLRGGRRPKRAGEGQVTLEFPSPEADDDEDPDADG